MKILLLAPVPPPDHGGIINWTRLVKTECAKRSDIELRFVDSALRYRDVTNMSILLRLTFGSVQALRDTFRVALQFYKWRPDVFHLCTSGGPASLKDAMLIAIAKLFNIPVAVHYRMGRLPQILSEKTIENRLIRYVLRYSTVVLVLGVSSEDAVKRTFPEQHVVNLPNMIDLNEIDFIRTQAFKQKVRHERIKITFIGHVVPLKGINELVQACKELNHEDVELHLVGPCSQEFSDALIKKVCEDGTKGDWLHLHGPVEHNEALGYLAGGDMFVLPSYTEGAPNVILEAMGMGKPILSTFVGAVPEMLDIDGPDVCGVCIKQKDPNAIRAAIQDFIQNPSKWKQMGCNARLRAERKYASPVACKQLTDIWYNLCGKSIVHP